MRFLGSRRVEHLAFYVMAKGKVVAVVGKKSLHAAFKKFRRLELLQKFDVIQAGLHQVDVCVIAALDAAIFFFELSNLKEYSQRKDCDQKLDDQKLKQDLSRRPTKIFSHMVVQGKAHA